MIAPKVAGPGTPLNPPFYVEYWCEARNCWREAVAADGRPLESLDFGWAQQAASALMTSNKVNVRIVNADGILVW